MEEEEKKICHLQSLLKKELNSTIKNKISPTIIKKKNIKNYIFDRNIVDHIKYYKNKNLKKDVVNAKKGQEILITEKFLDKSQKQICREGKENVVNFFRQECINEDLKSVESQERVSIWQNESVNVVGDELFNQQERPRCVYIDQGGLRSVNEEQEEDKEGLGQISSKSKIKSQKYKIAMISEFERIVNNTSLNDYKFINTSENKDIQIQITEAYKGIKNKDCRKWFYLLEFLKLTKNMSNIEIGEILGIKSDNFRKKMDGFKKVEYYLSHFQQCNKNYHSLNLQFLYFQKILIADWNEVLINLNRMVQLYLNNY